MFVNINKELDKDPGFFCLFIFCIMAIFFAHAYIGIIDYFMKTIVFNVKKDKIAILTCLLTTQLPLCIYIFEKNDGILKYNFVKYEIMRKTKSIYIVIALMLVLFSAIIIEMNLYSTILYVTVVSLLVFTIINEYLNVLNDISCINNEDYISDIMIKTAEKSDNIELLDFCNNINNREFTIKFYDKIINRKTKYCNYYIVNFIEYFKSKYYYVFNYSQSWNLNVKDLCFECIKKSFNEIEYFEKIRDKSIKYKNMETLAIIVEEMTQYVICIYNFFYENLDTNQSYIKDIEAYDEYFRFGYFRFFIYPDYYEIFLYNIFRIYSKILCINMSDCDIGKKISFLLQTIEKYSHCNGEKKNYLILFRFYVALINVILVSNRNNDFKAFNIKNIKQSMKKIFDFNNENNYLKCVADRRMRNYDNKFSVIFDYSNFKNIEGFNENDIYVCAYTWFANKYLCIKDIMYDKDIYLWYVKYLKTIDNEKIDLFITLNLIKNDDKEKVINFRDHFLNNCIMQ